MFFISSSPISGSNCEENLDECMSNPCQNDGICHDKDNGYICTCMPGYLGRHCENDVAVCDIGKCYTFTCSHFSLFNP